MQLWVRCLSKIRTCCSAATTTISIFVMERTLYSMYAFFYSLRSLYLGLETCFPSCLTFSLYFISLNKPLFHIYKYTLCAGGFPPILLLRVLGWTLPEEKRTLKLHLQQISIVSDIPSGSRNRLSSPLHIPDPVFLSAGPS